MPQHRYDTFLSHNSDDKPAVEALARLLEREGLSAWLDKWHLVPGKPWQEGLEEALTDCASFCVCIGPGEIGPWQNEEMRAAIGRRVSEAQGFRVIPVLLPGSSRPERSKLPTFLTQTTWVEFHKSVEEEEGLHRLRCAIRGVAPGPGPGQAIFDGVCPYRGLEVFDVEHAPFFFGRAALTEWLLDELKERGGRPANRFLAIIGASGSGKSSLARAGLVAELKQGSLPGSQHWPAIILKPGADPLETLAVNLAPDPAGIGEIRQQLLTNPGQLHLTTRFRLQDAPEDRRLLVLVDQFEEVFSLCRDPELRRAFIDNLLQAANTPLGQTLVLLTMRADFYGKCAEHDALAAALADHQLLVGPMNEAELREAIELPAYATGHELEPGLTDLLVKDVQGQSGGLPLLQYALSRLWENRRGNRLTVDSYQAIGGLKGALEQRADEIYRGFGKKQQAVCRRIFLRLTEPGEGTEDTRRRAWLSELGTDEDTRAVLEALTKGRLVTTGEGAVAESAVEVSHEALIRSWPLLKGWIEADREALRTQHQLSAAAREWLRHDRGPDYLYRGGRLSQAEEWAEDRRDSLSPDEQAFLEASLDLRDAEARRSEEQRRMELERARALANERARSAARLRWGLGGVFFLFLAAAGTAYFAYQKQLEATQARTRAETQEQAALAAKDDADRQRNLALEQQGLAEDRLVQVQEAQRSAESRLLAAQSTRLLHQDDALLVRALLLGVESLRLQMSQDAADAVRTGLARLPRPLARIQVAPGETGFGSDDGRLGLQLNRAFENEGSVFSSIGQWEARVSWEAEPMGILSAGSSCGGQPEWMKVEIDWGAKVARVTDTRSGEYRLLIHEGAITGCAVGRDGDLVATVSGDVHQELTQDIPGDQSLRVWDLRPTLGTLSQQWDGGPVLIATDFSPKGDLAAAAYNDADGVRVFDMKTGAQVHRLPVKKGSTIVDLSFSPNGELIGAAPIYDELFYVWSARNLEPIAVLRQDSGEGGIAFSPDARLVVTDYGGLASAGGADIWNLQSKTKVPEFSFAADGILDVHFHPDGKRFIKALDRGRTEIWDMAAKRPTGRIGPPESRGLTLSPDGKQVAFHDYGESVLVWSVDTGKQLLELKHSYDTATPRAFSADNRFLVTSDGSNRVHVWDLADGRSPVHTRTYTETIGGVAFSGSGRWLALSTYAYGGANLNAFRVSNVVDVLATDTWEPVARFHHQGLIDEIAFSADDRYLRTGTYLSEESGMAPAFVWLWQRDDLIEAACKRLTRNLTRAEWAEYMPSEPYRETCDNLLEKAGP